MAALAVIMTILLAVFVMLGRAVQRHRVADEVARADAGFTSQPQIDEQGILDSMRALTPESGPAPLGVALMVWGGSDPGLGARLLAVPATGAGSYEIHIRNVRDRPFDATLSTWLGTADGGTLGPAEVTLKAGSSTVAPGAESVFGLHFRIPAEARPASLGIGLHLGGYFPTAKWTLTP